MAISNINKEYIELITIIKNVCIGMNTYESQVYLSEIRRGVYMRAQKNIMIYRNIYNVLMITFAILINSVFIISYKSEIVYAKSDFVIQDDVLIKYNGNSKHVIIPDNVIGIDENAFTGTEFVTKITIPGSIKTIEWEYLSSCSNLKEIILTDGVEQLGRGCFSSNTKLERVSIPKTLYTFYSCSFSNCISLKNIDVNPENPYLSSVDGVLFSGSKTYLYRYPAGKSEKKYTVPDGVMTIWNQSFCEASNLETIVFPNTLEMIDYCSFELCTGLKSVDLPDSLIEIYDQAFDSCYNLKTINLPRNLELLSPSAFRSCRSLTNINIDKDNPYFTSESGYIYNKNMDKLILVPKTLSGSFTIPKNVKTIGEYALSSSQITSVIIPKNVRIIERDAFSDCSSLAAVEIANGVEEIGYSAFYNCSSLTKISLPKSIKKIGAYAFYDCISLSDISFAKGIEEIGMFAFYNTPWLYTQKDTFLIINNILVEYKGYYNEFNESINIPENVKKIGETAFYRNSSIKYVNIPDGVIEIGHMAFDSCDNLEVVNIPHSVVKIGSYAFYDNYELSVLILPSCITEIGEYVFGDMKDRIRLYVEPESVAHEYALKENIKYSFIDDISLNKEKLSLKKGQSSTLKLDKITKGIVWSSDNPKVATVSKSGKVKAKAKGKAVIRATFGNRKYECTVTVK